MGDLKYNRIEVDPNAKGIMQQATDRAISETPESIAKKYSKTYDDIGSKFLTPGSMGNVPFGEAIQNRARGLLQNKLNTLKDEDVINAQTEKSQMLDTASNYQKAMQNVEMRNRKRLMQTIAANKQARANVIKSILGLGSAVVSAGASGAFSGGGGGGVGNLSGGFQVDRMTPDGGTVWG